MSIWRLPSVLIIHLKRFLQTTQRTEKIDCKVLYPTDNLCLDKWVANRDEFGKRYELYGVSNHFGSLAGGHYVADVRNARNGKWYYLDDQSVTETTEDAVVKKSAYVLYYRLKVEDRESPAGGNN